MPLKELAPQIGMSQEYVDEIIDANLTMVVTEISNNERLLSSANAWALNGDLGRIYANAHSVLSNEQHARFEAF